MNPFRSLVGAVPDTEEPIRSELFGRERFELHAQTLARAQSVSNTPQRGRLLMPRVLENAHVLLDSYHAIARAIEDKQIITPAEEWLVDNFHVVDEQIREIRDDLPSSFYRQLPKLSSGPLEGYPRVYGLAWAFVAHTDSQFDPEELRNFIDAYQRVQPLTIGELWAVAISLRIILVENLRRLARQIVRSRLARSEADALADRLMIPEDDSEQASTQGLLELIGGTNLAPAFIVQLLQRLRDLRPHVRPVGEWLEQRLAAQSLTPSEIVMAEHQSQAAASATVRNIITSMRLISAFDWPEFFERVSLVDAAMRARSDFGSMDFKSRDSYRHAIEILSRDARLTELEIAQRALDRSARARAEGDDPERRGDAGYWLIGAGREPFERDLGARPTPREIALRLYKKGSLLGYVGSIGLGTAVVLIPLLVDAERDGAGILTLLAIGLLAAFPASGLAIALVNRSITHVLGPRTLPRLELRDGVPESLRTLVAVPTLLTSVGGVAEQIERIEVHYLSNSEGDLRFALLSDWMDATEEAGLASDLDLLAAARGGIARLNRRYGAAPGGGERFLLFHRRRVWSDSEQRFMGWERKRGKLHELNRYLRGASDTTFEGDPAHFMPDVPSVRYVITLDSDTKLPRGAARKLVGTMAHPLNRPRYDARAQRVVEGYAIAQPRITPSLPMDRGRTLFQWVFSGPCGIDPYAMAVSDVYQDLFDEGTFTGKGIYDVDCFEQALADKVPEASMLSHDLFEGIFARAALTTDVELVEDFPDHFESDAARQHRWARGDWQLLPWLFGIGGRKRAARPAPVTPLGRWKMFDNLRRSLIPPASFLTLLLAWTVPSLSPPLWTIFVLTALGFPSLMPFLYGLDPRATSISWRSHFSAVLADLWVGVCRFVLDVAFLAYDAWLKLDAMARTLTRLFVTHRHLLEWVTAAQSSYSGKYDIAQAYRRMAGGVVLAAAALLVMLLARPSALAIAAPFLVLWAAAPALAITISRPSAAPKDRVLSDRERRYLRRVARRTWRFFEEFVTAEQNFLPPDNFQEDPVPVVAHRTSPTNLGLYLLSILTARDFGWISTLEAVERFEATLASMARLERHRGHFFNWYDTANLCALEPRYVSTVDSGNLAGHLMTLANGCRDLLRFPGSGTLAFEGAQDVLALLREAAQPADGAVQKLSAHGLALEQAMTTLAGTLTEPGALEESRFVALRADLLAVSRHATALADERLDPADSELRAWARALEACLHSHARGESEGNSARLAVRLAAIVRIADTTARSMDFTFLYDNTRKLFSIGYRPADHCLDSGYYDLLASEARLTSFIAIAKGDVPVEHWFRLGRPLTPVGRGSALISWSGSMFEYLMPELVLRTPRESLLRQTCERAVRRQMSYGDERSVPWGISESAYNVRDRALTYQYSAFGVPGLRLQRGASDDIVIAPYASALAVMTLPGEAIKNLKRLALVGARGTYGFYESVDYTAMRVPPGQDYAVIRAFFAHHQGMSLVAFGNALHGGVMRNRFHADPIVQATELLLQERTPSDVMVARPHVDDVAAAWEVRALIPPAERRFTTPHGPLPRTQLLSNGRYAVMVTAAGSGYSRWRDLAVTRWREDAALDDHGSYIYLRDRATGAVWSAGHQPCGVEADEYEALFTEDHVSIMRRDQDLVTTLEIVVSSEEDAEVRRVSITNRGSKTREIEVTSYAELCLAPQRADVAHRAFSDLFVSTEFVPELGALIATRRMRSPTETPVWAACALAIDGDLLGPLEFETDRARFIGRGRNARRPIALDEGRTLSNTAGSVLDPIFSMRRTLRIASGATARISYSTLIASDRDAVLDLANKYRDPRVFERAMSWAWTLAQVQMRHLGIQADEANVFQRLANALLYSDSAVRPTSDALSQNTLPMNALWSRGISGDRPIVLARIDEEHDIEIIRQLLRAHEYWRMKLVPADLVILVERLPSYDQNLQGALDEVVRTTQMRTGSDTAAHQSGVFVLRADLITGEERILLQTVARAVLMGSGGTLFEQIVRAPRPEATVPPRQRRDRPRPAAPPSLPLPELQFFNGLGGFAEGGREYVITLDGGKRTPRPWINVIANPAFGFLASESGSGFTWSINSHENRLTPWSNDAVSDPPGEALYLRDEDSGESWTPTALPIRDPGGAYVVHHGQGYTRFRHASRGLRVELTQFVPKDDPIKISRILIENPSDSPRRLSLTAYVEWVLGEARNQPGPHVITERDARTGALLARSAFPGEFGGRVAFADLCGKQTSWTCDRTEFLGRNGSMARPRGQFHGTALSGRAGAGIDACAALRTTFDVPAGGRIELAFLLGQGEGREHAAVLVDRYRKADFDAVLAEVRAQWDEVLGAIEITTPDPAMDLMVNRWLLYQTLACRVWARAGFYQAGGAYGFRDQLQDVMALCVSQPAIVREHILRAAGRQFPEGDVQHWWHPPQGRGVRTRISDDLLWLPYAVARYLDVTGDRSILDEELPFLAGANLRENEDECYFQPGVSDQRAPLYEHCARAIDKSLPVGAHGLPLMGTGDWNDGMNRVGEHGKGESVWLAWFLNANLRAFAPLAEERGQFDRAVQWRGRKAALEAALDREAWDGEWYRRAYFDDGTPLGAAADAECRIDSIAQTWAVIAGGGMRERAVEAMAAVDRHLVRQKEQLVLLFTAPFDKTEKEPGYIKGYLPGIRENGGQYTHAAVWTVVAAAMLGQGDRAHELFTMLNPITHANTNDEIARYGGEPYVVAADVYSEPPHTGRAGWTWYTGAAGWLYRGAVEWILGFRIRGERCFFDPAIPAQWPGYQIRFRHGRSTYRAEIENPSLVASGIARLELDGVEIEGAEGIPLVDDGAEHVIRVVLGVAAGVTGVTESRTRS